MTSDGLLAGLRWLFWVLVYVGTICAAILAFAPSPYKWAVWVAVLAIVAHDAHGRFTDGSGALDG